MSNEKQILEKNVEDISRIIFGKSEINISVFSNGESIEYRNISTEYDFVCEIELREKEIQQEQVEKLSKFLKKEIKYSDTNLKKVFWLEGTNRYQEAETSISKSSELQKEITLPSFLDTYIFDKLGANFAPDFTKFSRNLKHKKEDVLIYLGTYFPRSFAESYSIFNTVFRNENVGKSLQEKKEINILDVGSGTGGNLSGLLLSLIENIPNRVNFNIVAIDGNNEALKILERIILQFRIKFGINISLNCHYVTFKTVKDLYEKSKQFLEKDFDFIISSKMINEIITVDEYSYYNYYNFFAKYLDKKGLLLMLDVTTKIEKLNYLPILLNKQTNNFIQQNSEVYKTLIPTSCAEKDNVCKQDCFSNNLFFITHSKQEKDKSKVAYRIIGKREFVSLVLSIVQNKGGIIGWDNYRNPKYCTLISSKDRTQNAYMV